MHTQLQDSQFSVKLGPERHWTSEKSVEEVFLSGNCVTL